MKAKIKDLPPGIGVSRDSNGKGGTFWRVRLGIKFTGGPIVRKTFDKLSDARDWIFGDAQKEKSTPGAVLDLKARAGRAAFEMTSAQIAEASAAFRVLGKQTGLLEAVNFFMHHTRPAGGERTVNDAIQELLAAKTRSGKKESYVRGLGWSLKKFAKDFEGAKMHEITRDDFETWLDEEEFSLPTRRNYIRDCSILFNYSIGKKWMAISPSEGVQKPEVEDREIVALTIRQAARLLVLARSSSQFRALLPAVAIQLFAGLRTSEISALDWKEVRSRQIIVLASKAKTRQRRTVSISGNLESWIAQDRKSEGSVAPQGREFRTLFQLFTKAARSQPWPRNALRHSFGSYHYAAHKNENLTAAEMGNSPSMVFKHYRAVILDGEESRYWNLHNKASAKIISFSEVA